MIPVLLKIGPIPIHAYGLMIALGFLTGLHLVRRDAKKAGLDPEAFTDGAFYALPIGILGTRILHIILYPGGYSLTDPIGWIAVWRGGLVFQGGPPLAAIFCYYYLRRRGVDFWKATDVVLPYLALAHAFGRGGCFLKGCCYGAPSNMPWAIPARRVPWDLTQAPTGSYAFLEHLRRYADVTSASHWSHPVHPTQLYSLLALLTLCATLLYLRKHWHPFPGFTMPAYFILYGIARFTIEYFRGDHNPVHLLGLSDQQILCLIFAAIGIPLYLILKKRARPPETLA